MTWNCRQRLVVALTAGDLHKTETVLCRHQGQGREEDLVTQSKVWDEIKAIPGVHQAVGLNSAGDARLPGTQVAIKGTRSGLRGNSKQETLG